MATKQLTLNLLKKQAEDIKAFINFNNWDVEVKEKKFTFNYFWD